MRILILNWRSIKDPMEGGAERATFEFAKRWVKNQNAKVTWLSPCYDSNIKNETIEGIDFEYVGLPLSRNIFWLLIVFPLFYISVIYTYLTKYKGKIDVVIDQVHGIPYLTPLYVKEKIVVYIHEVAGEIWEIMYPFPINYIGRFIEKNIFQLYKFKKIIFVANSGSTKSNICKDFGISTKLVEIVHNGVSAPLTTLENLEKKEEELTIVYLNRLVKMKGIERGLLVFSKVLETFPKAKLWVLGRGEEKYVEQIKTYSKEIGIYNSISFFGYISENEKFEKLGKAHVLMNPSYLEGWGLVNIEANRMGTPVVAFDIKGCRDSIVNGINGYLSPDGNIESMAEKIVKIYEEKNLLESSWKYSNNFEWDLLEKKFFKQLEK
jgi:glycosyltransferase involved in cell wall biosynthesis